MVEVLLKARVMPRRRIEGGRRFQILTFCIRNVQLWPTALILCACCVERALVWVPYRIFLIVRALRMWRTEMSMSKGARSQIRVRDGMLLQEQRDGTKWAAWLEGGAVCG